MLNKCDIQGTITAKFECGCELTLQITILYDDITGGSTGCRITHHKFCNDHKVIDINDLDCYSIIDAIDTEYTSKIAEKYPLNNGVGIYTTLLEIYDQVIIDKDVEDFIMPETEVSGC